MVKNSKELDKVKEVRECGVCTCIHLVINTCSLDDCEMFERKYMQEG
ncbi:hypothetical protein JOC73_001376 [Alkaliphilus hydrothermalis]|uniref:Uncharacterized protein n=1 Tax=Alkaliphilus hydrothermalis TaxID=1482730 RepID=A0ABS2NPJ7_9FIRM|nr:hypothetical protein [Alkaliphilus hydrothermalis]